MALHTILITARRSGTASTVVLKRGPAGPQGDTGPAGPQGDTGPAGSDARGRILPVTSGLVGAWDSDFSTLASGKIAAWSDLLGAGNDLVNATTAQQWTWDARGAIAPSQSNNRGYALTTPLAFNPRAATIVVIYPKIETMSTRGVASVFLWASNGGAPGIVTTGTGPVLLNGPNRSAGVMAFEPVNCLSFAFGPAKSECGSNGIFSTSAVFTSTTIESMTRLLCWPDPTAINYNINWDYPVKAIYVFDRALTQGEVLRIASAHGVQPPREKVLLCVGDSITKGFTAAAYDETWAVRVGAAYGATLLNAGFSGLTASAAYVSRSYYIAPTNRDVTFLVALGTNDLALDNSTAATLQSNLQNLCGHLKTTYPRARLVVQSILPRKDGFANGANAASFETARGTVNGWLAANFASFADAYMDFQDAAYASFNTQASADSATYYADKIHPRSVTHGMMATGYYGKLTW